MDFVTGEAQRQGWNNECIHVERFGAEIDTDGVPFTVIAKRSGKSFDVHPGETVADQLIANGIAVQRNPSVGPDASALFGFLNIDRTLGSDTPQTQLVELQKASGIVIVSNDLQGRAPWQHR